MKTTWKNKFFSNTIFYHHDLIPNITTSFQVLFFIYYFLITTSSVPQNSTKTIPHLIRNENAVQLIVNGNPFLILGGELGNSTASGLEYLKPFWENFKKINMNTILAPVYWELIEPEEGRFDFSLVDKLMGDAEGKNLKLVLLWFGAWKNSMSSYVPAWVKTDIKRFPRAQDKNGNGMEILTAFSRNNLEADKKAFTALMKHIKEFDKHQTVIMIQVENEIGMIPEARDYYSRANELFNSNVPEELMSYLNKNKEQLVPEFKSFWQKNNFKTSGTWEEVFGKSLYTDEVFMAWYYAKYVEEITAAGKKEYPLPMFVNAALIREGALPGQYPSAGPLPHLMDIWKAGAPSIDILSPDIYFENFSQWCQKYQRSENPLFIPETYGDHQSAANVFYALGQHDAIGFCPFAIESLDPQSHRLTKAYKILHQLTPLIIQSQGKGKMAGILLDKNHPEEKIKIGNYIFKASYELNDRYAEQPKEEDPRAGGIIIQMGENEYFMAGSGIIFTFESQNNKLPLAGILSSDEGRFVNGEWIAGRRLNGDQTHQGRHIRLPYMDFGIQRVKLYQYK